MRCARHNPLEAAWEERIEYDLGFAMLGLANLLGYYLDGTRLGG